MSTLHDRESSPNSRSGQCPWRVPGHSGCLLRNMLYGFEAGEGSIVMSGVIIYMASKLEIGQNSRITSGCQLNAEGGIRIGNQVLIGPGTFIWSQNHRYQSYDVPIVAGL